MYISGSAPAGAVVVIVVIILATDIRIANFLFLHTIKKSVLEDIGRMDSTSNRLSSLAVFTAVLAFGKLKVYCTAVYCRYVARRLCTATSYA